MGWQKVHRKLWCLVTRMRFIRTLLFTTTIYGQGFSRFNEKSHSGILWSYSIKVFEKVINADQKMSDSWFQKKTICFIAPWQWRFLDDDELRRRINRTSRNHPLSSSFEAYSETVTWRPIYKKTKDFEIYWRITKKRILLKTKKNAIKYKEDWIRKIN